MSFVFSFLMYFCIIYLYDCLGVNVNNINKVNIRNIGLIGFVFVKNLKYV